MCIRDSPYRTVPAEDTLQKVQSCPYTLRVCRREVFLTKDIPPEQLSVKPYRCSKKSVLFADGSYGILNVRNCLLDTSRCV